MKTTTLALAFALSAFGCANSATPAASPSASLACTQLPAESNQLLTNVLTPGATYGAQALTERRVIARAHQPTVVVGAEVHMPAPQGVTKEYLERVLTCHATTGVAAHNADPFHPSNGSVQDIAVKSSGGALAIQIRGNDRASSQEILNRAKSLTTPATNVTIEQVGSIGSNGAL
jgi:deferrochelatase/peroxidase EfeB